MIKKNSKLILISIILLSAILRLWKLNTVPPSLFGDELDVGYHAYSILKTGRDYSGNFMLLNFHSLAEWRTPLYLYSTVPTVALFGISPLGVRLPAAFFGILGVLGMYLLVKETVKDEKIAFISSAVLALSPWHIQYSRAAFEATQLLAFLIFGLYFFFRALNGDKKLWLSVVLIVITPLIYSTAKLFAPFLLIFLFLNWRKEILSFPKEKLVKAIIAGLAVGIPVIYATLFMGGTQRFGYISIFSDPTRETEVGYAREFDARVRGEMGAGLQPTITDKFFHNKLVFWGEKTADNFFQALSADFLFVNGDPNLRHSINGMGQFYKIEFVALILGIVLFFTSKLDKKIKLFLVFWLMVGILPSAITNNGGNHATRLILILPPLVFLISYGFVETWRKLKGKMRLLVVTGYILFYVLSFAFYQHKFWVHNPWGSERWWHYGWCDAVSLIKEIDENYDRVIISMDGEPAWIFFAGCYEYPPEKWHEEFPVGNDEYVDGFGEISHTGKYYFGVPQKDVGFYGISDYIDEKTLYLANASEVGTNLIMEPEREPAGFKLIKSFAYPSGEPAFYLFSGVEK